MVETVENNNSEKVPQPDKLSEKNDSSERILVSHGTGVYDVTSFAKIHPGGPGYLTRFKNKDISNVMDGKSHQHGPYAYRWMAQYRVGFAENFPEITPPDHVLPENDGFVNWTKPMLWQVGGLKERYLEWMDTPTDRKLRLFESDFVEFFSNTKWYMIPIVWFPIIIYMLFTASVAVDNFNLVKFFILGTFWWTFIEYTLHRFVFHLEPYHPDNGFLKPMTHNKFYLTFHFLLHGQHHKVPFDKGRLVFPPVPAAMLVLLFRSIFHVTSGFYIGEALMAGGIFGYVCYDMIHYYTHHGSIRKGSWIDKIRKYHIDHHFIDPNTGFGISSKLWDYPFQTIPEKELKKTS